MKWLAGVIPALILMGCEQPAVSGDAAGVFSLRQTQIDLEATRLNGLKVLSALELDASESAFGGFSGLLIDGKSFVAVSDRGWWLDAVVTTSPALKLTAPTLVRMRDTVGDTFEGEGNDAEGLTRQGVATMVSFERDHRVMTRQGPAQLGETRSHRAFEAFPTNMGLEALATLPDGRLLTISESRAEDGHVVYILGTNGIAERGWLPPTTRHVPTGADVGPDGKLYVVFRDYSLLLGVSIIIRRYELNETGLPDPATSEDLARFETSTGIDNMEGISLWRDDTGRTHLTLISDDNFNSLQRTLLVDLEVTH